MLLIRNGVGAVLLLAVAACATLEPEPSEDQIETAVAAQFHGIRDMVASVKGLEAVSGFADLRGVRKQRCTATEDVKRSGYICTVTLELKALLVTLHPTVDLRFIRSNSGWAVADPL